MNSDPFSRVEPFISGLKQYCMSLARNEWDAEDLTQEVLTKVCRSIRMSPDRALNKAYFYRIAKNAWIDQYRTRHTSATESLFDEEIHQPIMVPCNEMSVRESFEQLAGRLNARQIVLILMVDIFQFTAPETAQLLHTTAGAVKEGLKRARLRPQVLASQSRGSRKRPYLNQDISSPPRPSRNKYSSSFWQDFAPEIRTPSVVLT